MKKKKVWMIAGAVILALLLFYWLFMATLINSDDNEVVTPIELNTAE